MRNAEDKYVIDRHIKRNNRGFGKYHLVKTETKVTLCGVTLRYESSRRYGHSIEETLQSFQTSSRRSGYRARRNCKTCVKRAQKLRNPLDRLAEA